MHKLDICAFKSKFGLQSKAFICKIILLLGFRPNIFKFEENSNSNLPNLDYKKALVSGFHR